MYIELKTKRLLLRPVCVGDTDATFTYAGDAELTRWMTWFPRESPEETRAFLLQAEAEWRKDVPAYYEFAVLLGNTQIGGVSLWLNDDRTEGELGWLLRREYHGCGYAIESARALCDFGFKMLHLQKLTASCDARNTRSVRIMEKLGMRLINDSGIRQYKKRPETARELLYALDNT